MANAPHVPETLSSDAVPPTGRADSSGGSAAVGAGLLRSISANLGSLLITVAIVGLATALCSLMYGRFDGSNLIMVYLLGVAIVASRFGPREAVLAAVLSVAAFDVLFVPPRWTLAVANGQHLITFAVMLGVALLISSLALRLRNEARNSREREHQTAALYAMSRDLAACQSRREVSQAAARAIHTVFEGEVTVLLPKDGELALAEGSPQGSFEPEPAQYAFDRGSPAGAGTDNLPEATGIYLPLRSPHQILGVLALRPADPRAGLSSDQRDLIDAFTNAVAVAMERALLARRSHEAQVEVESERVRNALLSSISHDLRTPLTAIAGAASSLKNGQGDQRELAATIYDESMRLNLQVQNLLDMTRLQSGSVKPQLEWQSLEELVGSALERTAEVLGDRPVKAELPEDLPLLRVDGALVEKVLANLLENAAAHTPPGTPVEITAVALKQGIRVEVADHGTGFPPGAEARIFERFMSRSESRTAEGFGLGLAICRAIMRLHDGVIWAKNRSGGGAVFTLEFPRPANPPEVPVG